MAQGKELLWAFESDFFMNLLCTDLLCFNTGPKVSSTVYSYNSKPFSLVKCPSHCSHCSPLIGVPSYLHFPSEYVCLELLSAGFKIASEVGELCAARGTCGVSSPINGSGWLSTVHSVLLQYVILCFFLLVYMLEMYFCSFSSSKVLPFRFCSNMCYRYLFCEFFSVDALFHHFHLTKHFLDNKTSKPSNIFIFTLVYYNSQTEYLYTCFL